MTIHTAWTILNGEFAWEIITRDPCRSEQNSEYFKKEHWIHLHCRVTWIFFVYFNTEQYFFYVIKQCVIYLLQLKNASEISCFMQLIILLQLVV